MRIRVNVLLATARAVFIVFVLAPGAHAQSACTLTGYKAMPGLTATTDGGALVVTWNGSNNQELRMRLVINGGTPTIADLAVRQAGGSWATVAANATPEFRVISGWRRLDQEAYPALQISVGKVTQAVLDHYKWAAFWDAPLRVPGGESAHGGATPPPNGIPGTNQPGLPRKPEEVKRATASYSAQGCEVKTNGQRLEVSFPGLEMGIFSGRLQYTVYKGTNLIRLEAIAKTDQESVAYKYDAGLKGLSIQPSSQLVWRDTANVWQSNDFANAVNDAPATVVAANRLLAAQGSGGSLAVFPPPHTFFWTREISVNLGYNWYRKDSDKSFSLGIRQAESEADPAYGGGHGPDDQRQNFELYNARPGSWQRMPMYIEVNPQAGHAAIDAALAYTRNDHYKAIPGYWVMAGHLHTMMVGRLLARGGLNDALPDFELAQETGLNIFGSVDGGMGNMGAGVPRDASGTAAMMAQMTADHAQNLDLYYQAARLHASKTFLVMPDEEIAMGELAKQLGGHNDLLPSHPTYWLQGRAAGQPLVENDPKFGKLYHIGSPADLMEMTHRENMLMFMPHPDTKSSAGYPAAIKDTAYFRDPNYRGVGFRWGMDLDRSEQRLSDFRCMPLFDNMNNWVADLPTPPKYMNAITETMQLGLGDDFYANNPVSYIKTAGTPGVDNWKPVIDSMMKGDYFVSSGEMLITNYAVQGTGAQRTISADVEWTFPPEFAEVVWGDGQKTDRQIISMSDMPAFGTHHFAIPFSTTGKKWVRFAVWDSAGNGAFVQPIKLAGAGSPDQGSAAMAQR